MGIFSVIFILYLSISSGLLLSTTGQNLEYEYATLLGVIVTIVIPVIIGNAPVRYLNQLLKKARSWGHFLTFILLPALTGIWIPGVLLFLFNQCPCGQEEFAFWTTLQSTPAAFMSLGLSFIMINLRLRFLSRVPVNLFWLGVVFLITVEILAIIWFMPQKRITHWLTGFIHGPVYDSWIGVDMGIIYLRLSHIILGVLLVIACSKIMNRRFSKITAALLIFTWAGLHYKSVGYPGTSHGHKSLQKILPRSYEDPGFSMYFPESKAPSDELTSYEKTLILQTKFHISELSKIFGQDQPPHVRIYVYPDESTKKLWFGADTTDVTDVYSPSIHITSDPFPHPTLRHELVHALSSEFAWHGLGFHPNMALTEGLAVAFAPEFRTLSQDEGAASLLKKGRIGRVERLFSPFFWLESGHRAYTVAGSFSSYILRMYGPGPLKHLYGGGDANQTFEKPFETIVNQWKEFILSNYDDEKYGLLAESLYRSPGLLFDRCPHTKALYRRQPKDALTRLRQPDGWNPETHYRDWLLRLHNSEKWVTVSKFRKKASELIRSHQQDSSSAKSIQQLSEEIRSFASWPPTDIEDLELKILMSDLSVFSDPDRKGSDLMDLQMFLKEKNPGSGFIRQIHSRLQINQLPSEFNPTDWRLFLAGWKRMPEPDLTKTNLPWILKYLYFRNKSKVPELFLGKDSLVARMEDLPADESLPVDFSEQWLYKTGLTAAKLSYWDVASIAFAKSSELATPSKRERYSESSRMASFIEKNQKMQ